MNRVNRVVVSLALLLITSCESSERSTNTIDRGTVATPPDSNSVADATPTIQRSPGSGRIPQSEGTMTKALNFEGQIVLNLAFSGVNLATLDTSSQRIDSLPTVANYQDKAVDRAMLTETPDGGYVAVTENESLLSNGLRGHGTGVGSAPLALVATGDTLVAGVFDPNDQQRSQLVYAEYSAEGIGDWVTTVSARGVHGLVANGSEVVTWDASGEGFRRSTDGGRTWEQSVAADLVAACEIVSLVHDPEQGWMPICQDGRVGVGPYGEWTLTQIDLPLTKTSPNAHPLTRTDLGGANRRATVRAAHVTSTGLVFVVLTEGFEIPSDGTPQPGEVQLHWIEGSDLSVYRHTFVHEDDGTGLPFDNVQFVELGEGLNLVMASFENSDQSTGDTLWVVV